MIHLRRLQLPANLAIGKHTATDVYSRTFTEALLFRGVG
ncbi:hypothetical protein ABIC98_002897 [Arthrobacter nitrophenolicus]|uniref:Uncharacterized protein n=1 Tax=Arthrobacter nitrophenolicus TaxID=683150 RepID=A0ACC6THK6_9MICC